MTSEMQNKGRVAAEGLPTAGIPFTGLLSYVGLLMLGKGGPALKAFPLIAFMGFLSCVDFLMYNQAVILREGFSAVITGIRALFSMSPLVTDEIRFLTDSPHSLQSLCSFSEILPLYS